MDDEKEYYVVDDDSLESDFEESLLEPAMFEDGSDAPPIESLPNGDPMAKTIKDSGRSGLDGRELGEAEPMNRQDLEFIHAHENQQNETTDEAEGNTHNADINANSVAENGNRDNIGDETPAITLPDTKENAVTPFQSSNAEGEHSSEENVVEDIEDDEDELEETDSFHGDINVETDTDDITTNGSNSIVETVPPANSETADQPGQITTDSPANETQRSTHVKIDSSPDNNDSMENTETEEEIEPPVSSVISNHPTDNTFIGLFACKRNIFSTTTLNSVEQTLKPTEKDTSNVISQEENEKNANEQKETVNKGTPPQTENDDISVQKKVNEQKEVNEASDSTIAKTTPIITQNGDTSAKDTPEEVPAICPYCGNELILVPFNDRKFYMHRNPNECNKTFSSLQMIQEEAERIREEEERQRAIQEEVKALANAEVEQQQEKEDRETPPDTATTPITPSVSKTADIDSETAETMVSNDIVTSVPPANDLPKQESSQTTPGNNNQQQAAPVPTPGAEQQQPVPTAPNGMQSQMQPPASLQSMPQPMMQVPQQPQAQPYMQQGAMQQFPMNGQAISAISPSIISVPSVPPMQSGQEPNRFVFQSGMSPTEMLSIYTFLQQETEKQRKALELMHQELERLKQETKALNGEIHPDPEAMRKILQESLQEVLPTLPEFEKIIKAGDAVLAMDDEKKALTEDISKLNESAERIEKNVIALNKASDRVEGVTHTTYRIMSQYVSTVRPLEKIVIKMNDFIPNLNEYLGQIDAQYRNLRDKQQDALNELSNHFIKQANDLLGEARKKGFLSRPKPRSTMDKVQDFIIPTIIAFFMMLLITVINK